MRVFAIGDLHLSGNADKPMDVFGDKWEKHAKRIEEAWRETVDQNDIVLIPGDISWGIRLEDAFNDFELI